MDIFSKNKNLIIHFLVLMVFICIFVFFVRPFLMDIRGNANKLFETNRDFKFISERSDKINSARDDYKRMEPDLEKISGFLIDPKTPIDLIKFWEKTAENDGLDIDIASYPAEKGDNDLWPSMGFQIKLTGTFAGFMRFIEEMESSRYFLEIKNMSIIRSSEATGKIESGKISASLGIKIYTR